MKIHLAIICIFSALAIACNNSQGQKAASVDETDGEQTPSIRIAGVPLEVEIVQDAESRQLGLMYREELAEDRGMLFVFESPQILSFWMRNTYIPLDIAFIDANGVVVDIQQMQPLDESKNYVSGAAALYALEVNAGWFQQHNIAVGDRVLF